METNEPNDAELATHVKEICRPPATPDTATEDEVWQKVSRRLERREEAKRIVPPLRSAWPWWLAASTVAAGLLITVLLSSRHDPSWDMVRTSSCEKRTPDVQPRRMATAPMDVFKNQLEDNEARREMEVAEFLPPVERPGVVHEEGVVAEQIESSDDLAPLPIEIPKPTSIGTPKAPPKGVRLDPTHGGMKSTVSDVPLGGVGLETGIGEGGGTPDRRRVPGEEVSRSADGSETSSKLDTATVLTPPALESSKPAPAYLKSVAAPPAEPAAGPPALDVPAPKDVGAKRLPDVADSDARGTELDKLKEKAAELQRKIDEAERARTPAGRPGPYANLQEIKPNVPVLTGGIQDDNAEFGKFLGFLQQTSAPEAIKLAVSERVIIEVTDVNGLPLTNADVRIESNGRTVHKVRTTSSGQALFHPRVAGVDTQTQEFRATIVPPAGCQGQALAQTFRGRSGTWQIQVPYARPQDAVKLDILLCLDCTGSMSDEIERIQKTLQMMVSKFNALPGKPQTRWALVQYRDRGDQYVTQVHDFISDVGLFQQRLDACRADAGGDEPESVNEALDKAVEKVSWDRGDAIRLIFLVGDAPPHMDYQNDVKYTESMQKAQRRAIKIYPLAASGLNKTGEVIFRQLAQFTLARFLFISYGGSTPHQVSKPGQSNNLDDLIVHIVASEVNARATARRAPHRIEDPDRWE